MTEEVQSLLKLLLPLTDVDPTQPGSSGSEDPLDVALSQLQKVARVLALNHTKVRTHKGGLGLCACVFVCVLWMCVCVCVCVCAVAGRFQVV